MIMRVLIGMTFVSSTVFGQTPGKQKWAVATGDVVSSSTAIADDGTIYVGSRDDKLYAIKPDGTLKWTFSTRNDIYSSPAIGSDGTIYFGSLDSTFYALYPNGAIKWSFRAGHAVHGSAAIARDGTIYFGSLDNTLYALNPEGTLKWSFSAGNWIRSSPAIGSDGLIYFGSDDGKLYAVYPDGTLKWTFGTGGSISSSPAIGYDGVIYFGSKDKKVYAVQPDGTQKWTVTAGNEVACSPVIGRDGTIYIGSHDRKLYAITPAGALKWTFTTGDIIFSSLAIGDDDIIYVGSYDRKLYALNPDGSIKWTFATGNYIYSTSAISNDGLIYFGSWDKMVYALYSSSHGLADSAWPRFRNDNKNRGYLASLMVTPPGLDFTFVEAGGLRSYGLNLINCYPVGINVVQCRFDRSDFSCNTTLPIEIAAGGSALLPVTVPVNQTGFVSGRFELSYIKGSQTMITTGLIREGVFFEDGSEIARMAHQALDAYESCQTLDADSPATLNNLSVLYRLLGELSLADQYNQKALSASLNARFGYAGIKMNQGVIRSDQERRPAADSSYFNANQDVYESSALSSQIYYNLAWEDYQTDSLDAALTKINLTLDSETANTFLKAKAYVLRGAILYRLGDSEAGNCDFQQAISFDPDGPIGRVARENLVTEVAEGPQTLPREFVLMPNFPNPFNPSTTIRYGMPLATQIIISIYNVMGERLVILTNTFKPAGWHEIAWNGRDALGRMASSGVYLLKAEANGWQEMHKITLLK